MLQVGPHSSVVLEFPLERPTVGPVSRRYSSWTGDASRRERDFLPGCTPLIRLPHAGGDDLGQQSAARFSFATGSKIRSASFGGHSPARGRFTVAEPNRAPIFNRAWNVPLAAPHLAALAQSADYRQTSAPLPLVLSSRVGPIEVDGSLPLPLLPPLPTSDGFRLSMLGSHSTSPKPELLLDPVPHPPFGESRVTSQRFSLPSGAVWASGAVGQQSRQHSMESHSGAALMVAGDAESEGSGYLFRQPLPPFSNTHQRSEPFALGEALEGEVENRPPQQRPTAGDGIATSADLDAGGSSWTRALTVSTDRRSRDRGVDTGVDTNDVLSLHRPAAHGTIRGGLTLQDRTAGISSLSKHLDVVSGPSDHGNSGRMWSEGLGTAPSENGSVRVCWNGLLREGRSRLRHRSNITTTAKYVTAGVTISAAMIIGCIILFRSKRPTMSSPTSGRMPGDILLPFELATH